MTRAQILPIAATLLSWIWYVILVLSLSALSLFHLAVINRENKAVIYACVVVTGLCSILSLGVWMIFMRAWLCNDLAYVPYLLTEMEAEQQEDTANCLQLVWAVIAYMCGVLWGATSYCVFYFVNRHTAPSLRRTLDDRNSVTSHMSMASMTEEVPENVTIVFATED